MMINALNKELPPAAIIKPRVARPNGSKGGLEAMLRSLSAGSLTNLCSDQPTEPLTAAVVAATFNGLNVSAHSAFRPLRA